MPTLNFTEKDWARVKRDTMAWWEGELERPLVYLAVTDPVGYERPYGFLSNHPLDTPADEVIDLYEPFLTATHYYADAFPWWWVNFGPGMMAGLICFLGGFVLLQEGIRAGARIPRRSLHAFMPSSAVAALWTKEGFGHKEVIAVRVVAVSVESHAGVLIGVVRHCARPTGRGIIISSP